MERIDGDDPGRTAAPLPLARTRRGAALAPTWRPPGLAWAATFVFALGVGILAPDALSLVAAGVLDLHQRAARAE